jgi:hypothetical protein
MAKPMKDITGETFGRLKVLNFVGREKTHYYWKCSCSCGNEAIVEKSALLRKQVQSCGCVNSKGRCKGRNLFDISGEYGIGYSAKGSQFFFDIEDYERMKDIYWTITKKGYVMAAKNKSFLARLILGLPRNKNIHYINGNSSDVRKTNLSSTSPEQKISDSIEYAKKTGKKTKIKYLTTRKTEGCYPKKRKKGIKWQARIRLNKKTIHLGTFNTKKEAKAAYKKAKTEYIKKVTA